MSNATVRVVINLQRDRVKRADPPGLDSLRDREDRRAVLNQVEQELEQGLRENGIRARIITGDTSFNVADHRNCETEWYEEDPSEPGERHVFLKILVDDVANCYAVFALVHTHFFALFQDELKISSQYQGRARFRPYTPQF